MNPKFRKNPVTKYWRIYIALDSGAVNSGSIPEVHMKCKKYFYHTDNNNCKKNVSKKIRL